MATLASSTEVPLRRRARGQRLVGNLTLAMVLFVMVEVMLFLNDAPAKYNGWSQWPSTLDEAIGEFKNRFKVSA